MEEVRPHQPWLIAAWPGMGQVGITAVFYLMSMLRMHQIGEFGARDLFEIEGAEIENGILRAGRLPRSRLFYWQDPRGQRDIIVFIGEAQPPTGKLALCSRIIEAAKNLGAQRVLTFASISTGMDPRQAPHVFGVGTAPQIIEELTDRGVTPLRGGHISGLNGAFLTAAAEAGIPGIGLLGEIPAVASQVPYPSASVAVLRAMLGLAAIDLDLTELETYGSAVQEQLGLLYDQAREALRQIQAQMTGMVPSEFENPAEPINQESEIEPGVAPEEIARIEQLFAAAKEDRSKAFMLKKELDRLRIFYKYEDRFLDLFEKR